jgi:HEAT repeat protein
MQEGDDELTKWAALALGSLRLNEASVVSALTNGLTDPGPRVRSACASGLRRLGNRDKVVVGALVTLLRDPDADVRLAVTNALSVLAPELGIKRGAPVVDPARPRPVPTPAGFEEQDESE